MKSHGHIVFVAAVAVIVAIVSRRSPDLRKVLSSKKDAYDAEIKAIQAAHDKELEDREKALKRYDVAIRQIEEKYSKKSQALDSEKKKMIKTLISDNPDNPDEITERIAELTGFIVVDLD
jgi:CII-binding regulator of phage lambda lysogenization HflD